MFKKGDRAPDFTLPSSDGQPVSLNNTLAGGHDVLLIFLRHLG